jgi:hypothetical protein
MVGTVPLEEIRALAMTRLDAAVESVRLMVMAEADSCLHPLYSDLKVGVRTEGSWHLKLTVIVSTEIVLLTL